MITTMVVHGKWRKRRQNAGEAMLDGNLRLPVPDRGYVHVLGGTWSPEDGIGDTDITELVDEETFRRITIGDTIKITTTIEMVKAGSHTP